MPTLQKNSASDFESGAPPEETMRNRPPVPSRIFAKTSLSASLHCNFSNGLAVESPQRHAAARSETRIAHANIFFLNPAAARTHAPAAEMKSRRLHSDAKRSRNRRR